MSKGQKRGNREIKKPKQEKQKTVPDVPGAVLGAKTPSSPPPATSKK